ncbi:MAG: hypothetical protein O7E54_12815 [Planctomycetota bacterium]|nr:hypothetical protein [Planctomycetota bacterium]
MRKRVLVLAAACALLTLRARADEEFEWDREGYAELLEAAAEARKDGRRILVGLCGSPT